MVDEAVVHEVPYYSQWESAELVRAIIDGELNAAEDPRWGQSGAATPEEYAWWSWRLCGVACLRMALDYWWGLAPTALALAEECVAAGAYVRDGDSLRGLIHTPFAAYVRQRWGLAAQARELTPEELAAEVAGGRLAMVSVHPSIRDPEGPEPVRRGGHLVLAVGATSTALVIHNPSGFPGGSQAFAHVPWRSFGPFYAGRGIVLGPPGTGERVTV
ncbi:C39 family peptidase [Kitasatospora aureofaciens]|uniref:C39 family peptidase n=1 Tax=Kitasatospora aureofaciens TaxID=1894 RepID=UPI001C449D6D|nr:C39 family peptidase [Kitasatospora aureofaciens]MBV6698190.1 C39 family peptidase [Kitasatospora aureofaciens]